MTNELLYFKALKKWGMKMQLVVAIEELSEAQKEICKTLRNDCEPNHQKLADEIADSLIMLEQIQEMFDLKDDVQVFKKAKLNRLAERLECRHEFEAV